MIMDNIINITDEQNQQTEFESSVNKNFSEKVINTS